MSYSKADIQLAFESEAKDFETFISTLDEAKEKTKKAKLVEQLAKEAEEASKFEYYEAYSASGEWSTIKELESLMLPSIENSNFDAAHDYDEGVPDGGLCYDLIMKVNDTFFWVEVNSGSEWISDWSMRKNVPGDPEILRIDEVTEYEEYKYGIKIRDRKKLK